MPMSLSNSLRFHFRPFHFIAIHFRIHFHLASASLLNPLRSHSSVKPKCNRCQIEVNPKAKSKWPRSELGSEIEMTSKWNRKFNCWERPWGSKHKIFLEDKRYDLLREKIGKYRTPDPLFRPEMTWEASRTRTHERNETISWFWGVLSRTLFPQPDIHIKIFIHIYTYIHKNWCQ